MQPSIHIEKSFVKKKHTFYLLEQDNLPDKQDFSPDEQEWLKSKLATDDTLFPINKYSYWWVGFRVNQKDLPHLSKEAYRSAGNKAAGFLKKEKIREIQIGADKIEKEYLLAFLEGLMLSLYTFTKYKSKKEDYALDKILISNSLLNTKETEEMQNLVKATFMARDLVNEPVIYLTATQLSREIESLGEEAGFSVDVFEESKIQSLKMGGLLAVNSGSQEPPTFNILTYQPENAINESPIIFVGKGVVYDTGGLSLKPTGNSMDLMKSDMSGAATVIGAIYAIAKNKLPVHVVGLIPATDNRPGENAITPGDVITMHSGKTVEILNTDAEGRLILADALSYAKKYKPQLVLDFATLTGAAMRAIGPEGTVCMGTADEVVKNQLMEAGNEAYERLVEFPMWEEYEKQLDSDIADLTNLGGANAGATTAGIFLKHFTDGYPWMHFDIAGPAYLTKADSYRGKGGTGVGVRFLYQFIKKLSLNERK